MQNQKIEPHLKTVYRHFQILLSMFQSNHQYHHYHCCIHHSVHSGTVNWLAMQVKPFSLGNVFHQWFPNHFQLYSDDGWAESSFCSMQDGLHISKYLDLKILFACSSFSFFLLCSMCLCTAQLLNPTKIFDLF